MCLHDAQASGVERLFSLHSVEHDAFAIVHSESRIRQVTAENLNLIFTHDYWWPAPADNLYRPVTLLSYLFNYAILGDGGLLYTSRSR